MRLRLRAYSLIEVLIAFAVMSLVLAALLPGQTRLLNRSASEGHRLLALDWAMSHVDALGLNVPIQSGQQTVYWNDWELVLSVEPDQNYSGVYLIQATVLDERNRKIAELETVRGLQ